MTALGPGLYSTAPKLQSKHLIPVLSMLLVCVEEPARLLLLPGPTKKVAAVGPLQHREQ